MKKKTKTTEGRSRGRLNLNDLAREITLAEGLKKQISIAQVKEVIRLLMATLSTLDEGSLQATVRGCDAKPAG